MNRNDALDPAARIDGLLRREPVIWLSTVREDGRPHLVPVWFSWNGERLLVASKPHAVKVRNLRGDPRVMIALGEAEDDFDVGLVEAVAELPSTPAAQLLPACHLDKYARQLADLGLTREEFLATYSQIVVLRPTRFLPWHGRTMPGAGETRPSLTDRLKAMLRRPMRRAWLPRPMRRAFA